MFVGAGHHGVVPVQDAKRVVVRVLENTTQYQGVNLVQKTFLKINLRPHQQKFKILSDEEFLNPAFRIFCF